MVELFAVVKKSVVNGLTEVWPVNVSVSVPAVVVAVIPPAPTIVSVSFSCSATIFVWPATAMVPNESPPPPILPHAPAAYPSNSDVVVLYLNCPKAAVGL